ncbi:MAG: hypothetical protein WDO13_00005, partial [Verrucomicrobiota bacterium]
MAERDIDVFFSGRFAPSRSPDDPNLFGDLAHNPIRRQIYERTLRFKEQHKDRYTIWCVDGMVPNEKYAELLQRSKLVVCTESFGCETWRHYEVGAAGAVPLANWPYANNYMAFEPDVHAVYFSLIGDDYERTITRALADPGNSRKSRVMSAPTPSRTRNAATSARSSSTRR